MSAALEVLAIRELDGTGTLRAFVDVRIGGVTIHGAKIIAQPGKPAWIAMPSIKTSHGWSNVVELSKPLRERVSEVVLAAWQTRQSRQTPAHRAQPPTIDGDYREISSDADGGPPW